MSSNNDNKGNDSSDATTTINCDFLLDRLAKNVAKDPTKRAIAWLTPSPSCAGGKLERELTYQALAQETWRVTQQLLALQSSSSNKKNKSSSPVLNKGDRVVLVYPPSLDFMIAFLACLQANVIAVPVFPPNPLKRDTLQMFAKIFDGCGATVALTNTEYNHAKKLGSLKNAFANKSNNKNQKWPENLEWIVTDKKTSSSTTTTKSSSTAAPTAAVPSSLDSSNAAPKASDVAFLQYTSGSTSDPKGVMITHGNLAHNLSIITNELQAKTDAVVVSWLPQYHDMGLIGSYLGILYCGGTGYYMSPLSFLQRPMLWIEAVAKYRATHLQAPNFSFKLTARKFNESLSSSSSFQQTANNTCNSYNKETLNLSSVRHVINAAEPVDEESIESFYAAFGKFGLGNNVIFPTYGLAEHTVFVCSGGLQRLTVEKQPLEVDGRVIVVVNDDYSHSGQKSHSTSNEATTRLIGCGYPSRQGVDVQIVNPETLQRVSDDDSSVNMAAPAAVGEIWIHSPSKAAGYYQMPRETQEDFYAHIQCSNNIDNAELSKKAYLRTGDLGFMYKDELFICGRLKDLIIVGGRNYYPQDIEATAEAASSLVRPGCSAAFTMNPNGGGRDGTSEEQVALVMELKEVPGSNSGIDSFCLGLANEIRSAVTQEHSLAIAEIVFLTPRTIPKTSSGKIARSWCRRGLAGRTLKIVYRKNFKTTTTATTFEIESLNGGGGGDRTNKDTGNNNQTTGRVRGEAVRQLNKNEILQQLLMDISQIASIPASDIPQDSALVTMMDSLTLSQFKSMLESNYAVRQLSDEYLFRETTTPTKLVEVIKLGHAPDDEPNGSGGNTAATTSTNTPGQAKGLAGALGCPPGVVCIIL